MKVVYGHTDSIYVQVESVDKAKEVLEELNEHVRTLFPNILGLESHPVVLEFEKYFSTLGVGATANRNAGLISWEDGVYLDEPKFTMTGYTAKRISETKLASQFQTQALKNWAAGFSKQEMDDFCSKEYNETKNGEKDFSLIVKRSRMREERFNVKCPNCKSKYHLMAINFDKCKGLDEQEQPCLLPTSAFTTLQGKKPTIGSGVAGVVYGWSKGFDFDDSYLFIKTITREYFTHPLRRGRENVEFVSAPTLEVLQQYQPNWTYYAQSIVSKAKPIYEAMDWDMTNVTRDPGQTTLDEWF